MLIQQCTRAGFPEVVAVYPNNDPGSQGIVRAIEQATYPPVHSYQNIIRDRLQREFPGIRLAVKPGGIVADVLTFGTVSYTHLTLPTNREV